ncbi:hypothetical protein BKI52_44265 [marine bacterium AO1-C]|nr:hypothetical protein BKI52_44265 [marine bacterium AO1-C]
MTYYDDAFVSIGYDNHKHYTFMRFKKNCSSKQFRDYHYKMLDFFKEKQPNQHLVDTSKMGVISLEDQQYIGKNIIPQMARFSGEDTLHIAVIVSRDVFTKFAVQNIDKQTKAIDKKEKIDHQMFGNETNAIAWLEQNLRA